VPSRPCSRLPAGKPSDAAALDFTDGAGFEASAQAATDFGQRSLVDVEDEVEAYSDGEEVEGEDEQVCARGGGGRGAWRCRACGAAMSWAALHALGGSCADHPTDPRPPASLQAGKKAGGGLLSSFVRSLGVTVGSAALSRGDIAPALVQLKAKLMERNVAEEIAEK
jgi:hypothetical protein